MANDLKVLKRSFKNSRSFKKSRIVELLKTSSDSYGVSLAIRDHTVLPPPDTSEHGSPNPKQRTVLDLPTHEGWKAELTHVTRPQTVTHPSTNSAVHGRELNSQPVDYKSHK